MKKLIGLILLISTTIYGQNTGIFEKKSNNFYNNILIENNRYEDFSKKEKLSFNMSFKDIDIPNSLEEFSIIENEDPVSQGNTGTCWCFSTTSFYESEIHRLTGKNINLSELYPVYFEYIEKVKGFIRTRGESHLGEGSETNAVQRMMAKYGIVPYEAYEGKPSDQPYYNHSKMFNEIKTYLNHCKTVNFWNEDRIIENIKTILNHYMGTPPEKFKYKNKYFTPKSFLKQVTKINTNSYVDFMSLMEKPYWSQQEYIVTDNWWKSDVYYNIPLENFMLIIKQAVKNGFSISIGGDVSESGYSSKHDVAMIPSYDIPSDFIDENARQFRFSNGTTTDDHAIHLIGYKIDKNNKWWFLIKDSGSGSRNGRFPGYYFYHEDYIKLKMMTFTIHKDAVIETLKKMKND